MMKYSEIARKSNGRWNGPWIRLAAPILDVRSVYFTSYLTSNPAPVLDESRSALLIYQARRYVGHGFSDYGPVQHGADHYSERPYCVHGPLRDEPIFPPSQSIWRARYHLAGGGWVQKDCQTYDR